jgi:hypothetical protein
LSHAKAVWAVLFPTQRKRQVGQARPGSAAGLDLPRRPGEGIGEAQGAGYPVTVGHTASVRVIPAALT